MDLAKTFIAGVVAIGLLCSGYGRRNAQTPKRPKERVR